MVTATQLCVLQHSYGYRNTASYGYCNTAMFTATQPGYGFCKTAMVTATQPGYGYCNTAMVTTTQLWLPQHSYGTASDGYCKLWLLQAMVTAVMVTVSYGYYCTSYGCCKLWLLQAMVMQHSYASRNQQRAMMAGNVSYYLVLTIINIYWRSSVFRRSITGPERSVYTMSGPDLSKPSSERVHIVDDGLQTLKSRGSRQTP